jgi:hypothetical protein
VVSIAPKTAQQAAPRDSLDRRALPRVAVDIPTELELQGMGRLPSVSCDLSVGGICVSTRSRFSLDSLLRVTLQLPGKTLTLRARGRSQSEADGDQTFLTGVEFIEPPRRAVYELWDVVHETAKQLTTFLSTSSDLQALPLGDLMEIAHMTRYRSIPSGGRIYRQEERSFGGDSIFIILEGSVVLETCSRGGRRFELCRLGAGRLFGGTPLVTGTPHREDAIAAHDAGLLDISSEVFEKMKRQRPDLALLLSSAIVENHASRMHASLLHMAEAR